MPLPTDFHMIDGFPLFDITVTLPPGESFIVDTKQITVLYRQGYAPVAGCDFVAGYASRSFKNVFRGDDTVWAPPNGLPRVWIRRSLMCAVEDLQACTDALVAKVKEDLAVIIASLRDQLETLERSKV